MNSKPGGMLSGLVAFGLMFNVYFGTQAIILRNCGLVSLYGIDLGAGYDRNDWSCGQLASASVVPFFLLGALLVVSFIVPVWSDWEDKPVYRRNMSISIAIAISLLAVVILYPEGLYNGWSPIIAVRELILTLFY